MDAKGAIIMAKTINCYIAELLHAYKEITKKTWTEISLDFDVTLSNLYLYRKEKGNPGAKTIDKIVGGTEAHCHEALRRVNGQETEEPAAEN